MMITCFSRNHKILNIIKYNNEYNDKMIKILWNNNKIMNIMIKWKKYYEIIIK